ncbi:MAG: glycosyltransferase family 39 protein [Terriglobales bacterium]
MHLVSRSTSKQDPSSNHSSRLLSLTIISLLWLLIYAAGMFTPPLLDDVDTMHAEAAREMVSRHDWVTLYIDGVRYLEKPPLPYWAVAASYKMFGIGDWTTRFPLTLGVLALLFATYALGKLAYGERGGLFSATALATTIGPYIFTRFQIPDVIVALWLTLGFYFFLRAVKEERPSVVSCWGFAATCALNTLTKGLIGLVFPFAAIGLYLLLTGSLKLLRQLRLFSSTVVFLIIAAPWHVLAALRTPDQGAIRGFVWFYFVNEQILRYLNKRVPRDYDTVPLFLFWALLLVWAVPWVAFLPQSLRGVPARWRQWRSRLDTRQSASLLFALWLIVIVGFFSFSTRQEYYTIPAIPAIALLVGGWMQREEASSIGSSERRAGLRSSLALLICGILIFAAGTFFLLFSKTPAPGVELSDLLKKNPQNYALSFGHFLDLTPESMGAFRAPLAGFSLAFLFGTFFNWRARKQGHVAGGNTALIAMMVVVLTCVHSAYATFSPILSSSVLARAINRRSKPGDLIVIDGDYASASSLNFYTGDHVFVLHQPTATLWYGSLFPDAPHVWETESSLAVLWAGSARVFMWSDQEDPKELHGAERYLLASSGGKFLFSNRADE